MNSWRQRFGLIAVLIGKRRVLAALMFGVTLLAALAESVGLVLVMPILSGVLGLDSQPGFLADITGKIEGALPSAYQVEVLIVFLAVAFLLKGALVVTARGLTEYFSLRLRDDWAAALFDHYLSARRAEVAGQKLGAMAHNIAQEPYHASRGVALLFDFLNRLILITVLAVVLLMVSWQATIVVAGAGMLVFYSVRRSTFRYSVKFGKLRQKLFQQITAISTESVAAATEIKLFAAANRKLAEMGDRLRLHTRAETLFRVAKESPVQATEFMLIVIFGVGLLTMIRVLHIDPAAHATELGLFLLVGQRLLTNLNTIISQRMKIAAVIPAITLVHNLVSNVPARENVDVGGQFNGLDGDIEFQNVGFAYAPGAKILSGIDLVIPKGKITAIVGASGIGKSTVADMLLGFIAPTHGHIMVGGRDWSDFSLASLRREIGYASQVPMIFNATVRENIRFSSPDASDAQVIEAAQIAHADEFIDALVDGYDTMLGDRGENLSGGQRQRIAIARVILPRPGIYVFDEATNALDSESENLVRDAILGLSEDATLILIAHGSSVLGKSDVIYRLDSDGAHEVTLQEVGAA